MTTNIKDIEQLVDQNCSSISFIELDRLLNKLDHEDLDVLRDMLEDVYQTGTYNFDSALELEYQSGYDKGYSDRYSDGFSTEE